MSAAAILNLHDYYEKFTKTLGNAPKNCACDESTSSEPEPIPTSVGPDDITESEVDPLFIATTAQPPDLTESNDSVDPAVDGSGESNPSTYNDDYGTTFVDSDDYEPELGSPHTSSLAPSEETTVPEEESTYTPTTVTVENATTEGVSDEVTPTESEEDPELGSPHTFSSVSTEESTESELCTTDTPTTDAPDETTVTNEEVTTIDCEEEPELGSPHTQPSTLPTPTVPDETTMEATTTESEATEPESNSTETHSESKEVDESEVESIESEEEPELGSPHTSTECEEHTTYVPSTEIPDSTTAAIEEYAPNEGEGEPELGSPHTTSSAPSEDATEPEEFSTVTPTTAIPDVTTLVPEKVTTIDSAQNPDHHQDEHSEEVDESEVLSIESEEEEPESGTPHTQPVTIPTTTVPDETTVGMESVPDPTETHSQSEEEDDSSVESIESEEEPGLVSTHTTTLPDITTTECTTIESEGTEPQPDTTTLHPDHHQQEHSEEGGEIDESEVLSIESEEEEEPELGSTHMQPADIPTTIHSDNTTTETTTEKASTLIPSTTAPDTVTSEEDEDVSSIESEEETEPHPPHPQLPKEVTEDKTHELSVANQVKHDCSPVSMETNSNCSSTEPKTVYLKIQQPCKLIIDLLDFPKVKSITSLEQTGKTNAFIKYFAKNSWLTLYLLYRFREG